MAEAVVTRCPHCQASLKVPGELCGKRIKCKKCEQTFVLPPAAGKAAKSAAPPPVSASAATGSATPPASSAAGGTATPPKRPFADDDEGVAQVGVVMEKDVPRCPHCALELVPPDAIVCIHCGFNNRTRVKADTRKVYAPSFGDWFMHLAPGVVALVTCIGLIVLNYITATNMRDWLEGTFLEMDEVDAAGRKRFYIAPGAFIFLIAFISLSIFIPCLRFGIRRLFVEYRPPERLKLK